jgi:RNA polymerase sigma factor (sigma-70 family)
LLGDREKLLAFRAGQSDVMTDVFHATASQVRMVLRSCGISSAADLDDAMQTVYTRAFAPDARSSYSGLSHYVVYLKAIARNVVKDLRKSGRARFELLTEQPLDSYQELENSPKSPEHLVAEQEAARLRDMFVDGLKPEAQRVYAVCISAGRTEREASGKLGLSRHRVRRLLDDIRQSLGRFVREHDLDE